MIPIQILSDLHLESPPSYHIFEITPKAPYLALLGDIGNVVKHKPQLFEFLTRQLYNFRTVFFVAGNHEAYHSTWLQTISVLEEFQVDVATRRQDKDPRLGEFVFMDRKAFTLSEPLTGKGDLRILGCSLFSHVPQESSAAVERGLNDFYHTGDDWTVGEHNKTHTRDVAWLNEEVIKAEQDSKIRAVAILTHWTPTLDDRGIEPRHKGGAINRAFSTDLSGEPCWNGSKVSAWACGHTHFNFDFLAERSAGLKALRVVTNQRGYYFRQAEGFEEGKVIEL